MICHLFNKIRDGKDGLFSAHDRWFHHAVTRRGAAALSRPLIHHGAAALQVTLSKVVEARTGGPAARFMAVSEREEKDK